jgi:hypothetical protein
MTTNAERITPLLAGMDTVHFSCDLPLSDTMRERLTQEKATAQARATQRQVHCLEWLEARIAPQGAKGWLYLPHRDGRFPRQAAGRAHPEPSQRLHRDALACAPSPSGRRSRRV